MGLEYHSGERFRITHTGSFFGQRNPRTFLSALAKSGLDDVVARFVGDFRAADREWVETLGPRRPARAAAVRPAPPGARAAARLRGEPAPAAGRRRTRPGRAERQDLRVPRGGAADPGCGSARRGRRRADPRDGRRGCRRARRRARFARGAPRPARALAGREADGRLLSEEQRRRLSRKTRVEELANLLWSLAVRRESRLVPFFFLADGLLRHLREGAVAGRGLGLPRRPHRHGLPGRLRARPDRPRGADACRGRRRVLLVFLGAFLLVYLIGFFNLETTQAFDQFGKGIVKFGCSTSASSSSASSTSTRRADAVLLADARLVPRPGSSFNARLRDPAAARGAVRRATSTRSSCGR